MSRDLLNHLIICAVTALMLFAAPALAEGEDEESGVSLSLSTESDSEGDDELGRPNHRSFNLHLFAGAAFALGEDLEDAGYGDIGGQGALGLDWVLAEPLAFSILGGYNGFVTDDVEGLRDLFVGAGFRLRFLANRGGALNEEGGNPWGNLWLDAHISYHHYDLDHHGGFNVGLGYEFSLAKDFNFGPYGRFQYTPWGGGLEYTMFAVGVQFSLGGQLEPDDRDGDGVLDDDDECPDEAEDKDGFEDDDGCPDADNDQDGILDGDDECPDLAGVADKNGCPDDDVDRDGIKNDVDKCPDDAEDKDEFEDDDGCPDTDNDQDGVLDADDKCLNEAEDKDGFEDDDGCPDADNDQDGILDANDQCPNEPETVNEKDDEDGCPDLVRVEGGQIKILQKVYFATAKDKILERSFPVLEEVAAVIKLKAEIKVRVEGHTDDKGNDKRNQSLSERRAASVVKFLVEQGVEEERLMAEGKGETVPIADNKTADGRAQNRRVEFHIIQPPKPEPAAEEAAPTEGEAPAEAPAEEAPAAE
jgi:outer membrane protein OmpA-like peptidoglycan-associated protein